MTLARNRLHRVRMKRKRVLLDWLIPLLCGLFMVVATLGLYRQVDRSFRSLPASLSLSADEVILWEQAPVADIPDLVQTEVSRRPIFTREDIQLFSGDTWFELRPEALFEGQPVLEIGRSDVSHASLLTYFANGELTIDTLKIEMKPENRPISSRRMAFDLSPNGRAYFLLLHTAFPGVAKLTLWKDRNSFYTGQRSHDSLIAFYLGIVSILFVLNAFVYVTTRGRLYFDYALFLFFHGASTLVYEGFYIGTPLAAVPGVHQILLISIPLSVFAVLRFAERFLELDTSRGLGFWLFRSLSFIFLLLLSQLLFLGIPSIWGGFLTVQSFAVLVTVFALLGVAMQQAIHGGRPQLIFLLAFIPHVMAVSIFLSGRLGFSTPDPLFYYKLIVSSILEMILITLALALAVRVAIQNREKANAEALDALERTRRMELRFSEDLKVQVAERTEQLARADTQKSHILSLLAHDLRSPLNSIVQITDFSLRQAKGLERDHSDILQSIYQTSRSLYLLLDNLLGWARWNWEGRQPTMQTFFLKEALEPALDLYREAIKLKRISVQGDENWNVEIFADRGMVRTLVRNLVSNAIQHAPDSGLLRFQASLENGLLFFGMANSGRAIPKDVIESLIEEETDSHAAGRRGRDSDTIAAGLGLLLCREVVGAHDGVLKFGMLEDVGPLVEFHVPPPA